MNDEFNKKIAKDFGLEKMETAEQEKMIEKIGTLLFESVVERAVDTMEDKDMNDFEDVVGNAEGNYERIVNFLKERVKGFDAIVSEELDRLRRATSHIFV